MPSYTFSLLIFSPSQDIWTIFFFLFLFLLKVKSLIEWGPKIRSVFINAKWVHSHSLKNINRSQTCTYSTLHQGPSCLFWNATEVLQTERAPEAKCIYKNAQLSGTHNQVKMWSWDLCWWFGICSVISPSCPQTSVRIWLL